VNFDVALHNGIARVVEVLRVETDAGETLVTVREEPGPVEPATIVLTEGTCSTTGVMLAGRRYVVITGATDARGRHELYTGVGAEYSILQIDDSGAVRTPVGTRDAAGLVARARRPS
jgi:translation initiation factor IF-2